MSVDTRTKGRRLDGYTKRRIDGHEVLLDPDLLKLPIELTITSGGIYVLPLSEVELKQHSEVDRLKFGNEVFDQMAGSGVFDHG